MPHQTVENRPDEIIRLRDFNNDLYWRTIFNRYDTDNDGKISYRELQALISSREYKDDIPPVIIHKIHKEFDTNRNGYLSFEEFLDMIHNPKLHNFFGHFIHRYVKTLVPCPKQEDSVDGAYEDEYTCWPPAITMIIVSIIEIAFFMADKLHGNMYNNSIVNLLIFTPSHKAEIWRFVTYIVLHDGIVHLTVNVIVQILLGIPLEMVHRWWRVLLIYMVGVISGSLLTSVVDPNVSLVGASGGSYALMTAHVATIIMNWREMDLAVIQMAAFSTLAVVDISNAVWSRYVLHVDRRIAYAAHFGGALAGLLIGLNILRNLEVTKTERVVKYISFIIFLIFVVAAIFWNVLYSIPTK